jgi:DNA-binding GntR family transcriptional regulator
MASARTTGSPRADRAVTVVASPVLADSVYQAVRRDIVRGVLRPNEPLVEADIAERLQVSRTPVRESMQRLAAERLIVSRRRRWYVYEHSRAEIAEIYEARAALEGYAVRLAAERATSQQLASLRRQLRASASTVTGDKQVEANDSFHDLLTETAGNQRIKALIEGNRHFHFNFRIADSYSADEVAGWHREHDGIVDAIAAHDGARAEELAREHVLGALGLILAKFY